MIPKKVLPPTPREVLNGEEYASIDQFLNMDMRKFYTINRKDIKKNTHGKNWVVVLTDFDDMAIVNAEINCFVVSISLQFLRS